MKRFFLKKGRIAAAAIWAAVIILNVTAWLCAPFCDWYRAHIFLLWLNTYGRITGIFPFSIGEWMLYLAAVLVIAAALLWIPMFAVRRMRRDLGLFYRITAWIVTVVCLVMTLNCFILYHCTPLGQKGVTYDTEELIALRERIVTNCNRLCREMKRDEHGKIIYEGDMASQAKKALHTLAEAENMPYFGGFYSDPKPLAASWFFSQQYICGYYFPFSMEANYNRMMEIMNKPFTMCHELSHLRGYILEDEANYIAYLACVGSGDPVFEYSGYLNVLHYVENDLYDALKEQGALARYDMLTPVLSQVHTDNLFLSKENWEKVEQISPVDTQVVSDVTDVFLEKNLTANGVSDGILSYSRVVGLLLAYYHDAYVQGG